MSATHIVIVGGPEVEDELLAIVLDDGEAIPVFGSVDEAREFLDSTGDFGKDWHPLQVSAQHLVSLLEGQGEEVKFVALSPPPERWEGGMEVQVLERTVLTELLKRQTEPGGEPPQEKTAPRRKGLWRRLFGG